LFRILGKEISGQTKASTLSVARKDIDEVNFAVIECPLLILSEQMKLKVGPHIEEKL